MKAVMYGAGNIGRGFIGAALSASGYEVCFIDVADPVVDRLNAEGGYPLRILGRDGRRDLRVERVRAVNGKNADAAAEEIASADLMATAVGAKILPYIAPVIAAGLKKRFERCDTPLDIIICENLMDADRILGGLIAEHLDEGGRELFARRVGLVEASIGRMVPVQTPEMQDGEPLRVCVEEYASLPVDAAAFKGPVPPIEGLAPFTPFDFYIKRKLFLHNMGHAVCAYLGGSAGHRLICDAIGDDRVRVCVREAMDESALALSMEYGVDYKAVYYNLNDLILRFGNRALGDTCERVGADQRRKLAPTDRLTGAALLCLRHGLFPAYIALGIAAGLLRFERENALDPDTGVRERLEALCGRMPAGLEEAILSLHALMAGGAQLSDLRDACDRLRADAAGRVV